VWTRNPRKAYEPRLAFSDLTLPDWRQVGGMRPVPAAPADVIVDPILGQTTEGVVEGFDPHHCELLVLVDAGFGIGHVPNDALVLLSEVLNYDFASKPIDEQFTDEELAEFSFQGFRDRAHRRRSGCMGDAGPTLLPLMPSTRRGNRWWVHYGATAAPA
jgi:hypothetical protein